MYDPSYKLIGKKMNTAIHKFTVKLDEIRDSQPYFIDFMDFIDFIDVHIDFIDFP